MAFRVEIGSRALADAEEIFTWIARSSIEAAQSWVVSLWRITDTLTDMPARCPIAPEAAMASAEIRQLLMGKRPNVYRVLFEIEGDLVRVIRILHSARSFE